MKSKVVLIVIFCMISIFNSYAIEEKIDKLQTKSLIAPAGVSYQWYLNGKVLEGVTNKEAVVIGEGSYTVKVLDAKGDEAFREFKVGEAQEVNQLFVIGDSTASYYDAGSFPRTGWAQVFQPFFDADKIQVVDKAISGRSSRSFHTDANGWPVVLKSLGTGDFLFIQFGHNDSKQDDRFTDPYTTYQEYLSIYIDTALARGAYPVLVTSIHRNGWSGASIKDSHGDYPPAMRALATEKNIPLIDLHMLTKSMFEAYGEDFVTNNFFNNLPANVYDNYLSGNSDNTHLQVRGGYEVSKLTANAIEDQKGDFQSLAQLADALQPATFIDIKITPALSGNITGDRVVSKSSEVTIKASPKTGYALDKFKSVSSDLSTDINYTFTPSDTMVDITAVFDVGYRVSVSRTPSKGGSVEGSRSYIAGATATVIAHAKPGYQFTGWLQNEAIVSTDTLYSFTIAEEDVSIKAQFEEVTTSIEVHKLNTFDVYPIPAKHKLNINSENLINNLSLYTLSGSCVLMKNITDFNTVLEVSELEKGIFILRVNTAQGTYSKKVVIE